MVIDVCDMRAGFFQLGEKRREREKQSRRKASRELVRRLIVINVLSNGLYKGGNTWWLELLVCIDLLLALVVRHSLRLLDDSQKGVVAPTLALFTFYPALFSSRIVIYHVAQQVILLCPVVALND